MGDEQPAEVKALAERTIAALKSKGISGTCPRCSRQSWTVELLGVLVTTYPAAGAVFSIPPPHLPSAVLTCTHCGFMAMHNLKVLGVTP